MSTLTVQTISNGTVSTSSQNVIRGSARAWVNFDGTAASLITPRSSYNVGSITKTAAGTYYMNFTTALPNVNYAVICSAGPSVASGNLQTITNPIGTGGSSTTQCGITTTVGGSFNIGDVNYVNIAVFSS